jgi:RNA polymerase sigma factor (sigma-70 family)
VKFDDSVLAQACAGSDAAAAELFQSAWTDAYRIAWSILRDRSAAEDAAQEACARAWSKLRSLRRPERFSVWFYRIVVNESKRIQHASRHTVASVSEVPSHDAQEDRIAVRMAVDALDRRLRLPIVLRYYYGLRSTEIARVLGASPITVRWWLMLAYRRLAHSLHDGALPSHSKAHSDGRVADESIAAN